VAHARFQKWQELGIFEQVMVELVRFYDKKRKIRWKWQAIDGKNCPAPLGGNETGRNPNNQVNVAARSMGLLPMRSRHRG